MKSPRITKQRTVVYDIKNCGPNHRYLVDTKLGPVLAHNCTQATANDLLRNALRLIPDVILPPHDEIVCEVPIDRAAEVEQSMRSVMCSPPAWATGLPLEVEIKIMQRYGK